MISFGLSQAAFGQILDDSTKEIFTHRTVRYRIESNLISDRGFELSDTSLVNFSQNSDFLYQGSRWFQNLGVFGSAAKPLYFTLPETVGLRYGSNAFDYLLPNSSQIQYYNTLSPFTSIHYVQGGRKRQMLRAIFSQNVTSRWNVTGYYQRFTALRTINVTQSEQRQNDHHSLYLSTNYTSPNKKLLLWGYYQHANQLAYETGGIQPAVGDTKDSLFSGEIEAARLDLDARNRELRNNWHINLKWKPFESGFFIRSAHTRTKQINRYTDFLPDSVFYGGQLFFQKNGQTGTALRGDTLFNERIYRIWENTVYAGFEDSLFSLSVFARKRNTIYYSNLYTTLASREETVYGSLASAYLFKGILSGRAEFLNKNEWNIQGVWSGYGLTFLARWYAYRPSIMQQEFVSKNLLYQTDFQGTKAFHLSINQTIALGKWKIIPCYDQFIVSDGIAFDTNYRPFQVSGTSAIQLLKIGLNGQIGKVFYTNNQFVKVLQSGPLISQMPGMAYRSAHWVELVRKKRGYGVQLGVNLDWRADVQSESYQPLTGQWYLQKEFTIQPYFLCDLFLHIRIQRARIYMKVHNINQGFGSPGYFAAPFYPGQRRLFEVGLVWTFYD